MAIAKYDTSTKKYLLLDSYRSNNRGTSSGYAWKTASQLSSSLGITKYFLINPTKGPAPTISSCKATSDSAIKIEWNKVSGAEEYKIERTENDGANKKTIKDITNTSYSDTGLIFVYSI